jgi:hypothetical protein
MRNEIATTIWQQIPTSTKMACGAREPTADTNCLIFKVLNGSTHRIKVTLDPYDTYTVELFKQKRDYSVSVVEKHEDVYCDMLGEVIYHMVNK